MKIKTILIFLFLFTVVAHAQQNSSEKTRLLILADMGNEPDEEQQMMHMLMYCNEFDLEGLVAVSGKYLQPASKNPYRQVLHPELFHHLILGYSKVYKNLQKHADGYPEPEFLTNLVRTGQPGYGIESTGEGLSSPGSDLIIRVVEKDDPRPVYIVVNAGSNTLAQAIKDYEKAHSAAELARFISKLRVYENGAQDNAGAWICAQYPEINWIRSNYQTYCYGGPANDGIADNKGDRSRLGPHTWGEYEYSSIGQHQWALQHIIANHGAFGRYFPLRQFENGHVTFLEGGGTIPWLGLCNKGLYDIEHPHWGGWSGRFTKEKVKNFWSKHTSVNVDEKEYGDFYMFIEAEDQWVNPETGKEFNDWFTPIWRFRRAFFNDFQCRMDWCFQPFEKANHNPNAAVNGDRSNRIVFLNAKPGEQILLDGSASSDPDGDELEFLWWCYAEAGTYPEKLELKNAENQTFNFVVPKDAKGKEIHIILEVQDKNEIASLFDYGRIVINVE
ncbi:nucleoside hydrolase-like domain-containing protein [uncultured Draconibacterium sp.]|uniref:nucleoside hydrolase-like domain-containing protein n=1 Tax=uncultured Draconibacterium sp. TaxID=1573823 RepID=UPI003260D8A0